MDRVCAHASPFAAHIFCLSDVGFADAKSLQQKEGQAQGNRLLMQKVEKQLIGESKYVERLARTPRTLTRARTQATNRSIHLNVLTLFPLHARTHAGYTRTLFLTVNRSTTATGAMCAQMREQANVTTALLAVSMFVIRACSKHRKMVSVVRMCGVVIVCVTNVVWS